MKLQRKIFWHLLALSLFLLLLAFGCGGIEDDLDWSSDQGLRNVDLSGLGKADGWGQDSLSISAGKSHTCKTVNGEVYCWGSDPFSRLIPNPSTNGAQRIPNLTEVVSVASGDLGVCALTKQQEVQCLGSEYNSRTPVKIRTQSPFGPVLKGVISVVAAEHACALTDKGDVYCWGSNRFGQLGNGTTSIRSQIVAVRIPGLEGMVSISAGERHVCAVQKIDDSDPKYNGEVFCWGSGSKGQLGNGEYRNSKVPVKVDSPAGLMGVQSVSAGGENTCAVTEHYLFCWGSNNRNQVAINHASQTRSYCNDRYTACATPMRIETDAKVKSVALGSEHICVALENDEVRCWGNGQHKATGCALSFHTGVNRPNIIRGINNVLSLTAGRYHTCAIERSGDAYCWGRGWQLGNGASWPTDSHEPQKVVYVDTNEDQPTQDSQPTQGGAGVDNPTQDDDRVLEAGDTGTLIGVISWDEARQERIPGVQVFTSKGQSATTDVTGLFRMSGVPSGEVSIYAWAPGYLAATADWRVYQDELRWASMVVTPKSDSNRDKQITPVGVTSGSNPVFSWNNIPSTTGYKVVVRSAQDQGTVRVYEGHVSGATGGTIASSIDLSLDAGKWQWAVFALGNNGAVLASSEVAEFIVN